MKMFLASSTVALCVHVKLTPCVNVISEQMHALMHIDIHRSGAVQSVCKYVFV